MTRKQLINLGLELDCFTAGQLNMIRKNENHFTAQQLFNILAIAYPLFLEI